MPKAPFGDLLQYLRRMYPADAARDRSDGELLNRFVAEREESAFTVLVGRHGPMVLGLCERLLGDRHLAEDAFQATFLVLARRAASVGWHRSVGTWLYAVAQRVALKARAKASASRNRERESATMARAQRLDEHTWQELRSIIDEEIARLPEKYQAPLVFCYLEGKSHDRAAKELDCAKTTLERRLARARELLRKQLIRRGVTLSAAVLGAALCEKVMGAPVAALLTKNTVQAAVHMLAGNAIAGGCITARALALAEEAMVGMVSVQGKLVVMVLALGLAIGGAGWAAYGGLVETAQPVPPANAHSLAPKKQDSVKKDSPSAVDQYGDPLPPGAVARLGTVRWRHDGFIPFVGFLPDGKALVSAGNEGPVIVRELATGRELRRFNRVKVTEYVGGAVALSPKGELLICSGPLLQIYNSATGEKLAEIKTEGLPTVEIALAPDGKSLATIRLDGSISLYDRATLRETHHFNQPPGPEKSNRKRRVASLAFSPDGKLLASVDIEGPASEWICLWDTATGKEIRRVKDGLGEPPLPRSPSFSPDGKLLAWIDIHGTARVRNLATRSDIAQLSFVIGFTFTPDSKSLVTYNSDQTGIGVLKIENSSAHRVATREETRQWVSWSRDFEPRQPFAISPDGKVVAVAGEQNQIRLIDLGTGQDRFAGLGQRFPVSWISYSRNGKTLTTWGTGDKMWQWDVATGNMIGNVILPAGLFSHVAISPDNKRLATVGMMMSKRDRFEIWDTATRASLHELGKPAPGTIAPTAAFSPDGKTLAAWGLGQTQAWLYDVRTAKKLRTLDLGDGVAPDQRGTITIPPLRGSAMVFSPDSRLLAMRSGGRTVGVWNVASGRSVRQLLLPASLPAEQWLGSGAFTPDGRSLAVEMGDGTVIVWEIATGRERCRLVAMIKRAPDSTTKRLVQVSPNRVGTGRFDEVWSGVGLAISQDGDLLAQGAGRTTCVWDLVTGKEITRLNGHEGNVTVVAFAPDGKTLATGSADTTTLIWDVTAFMKDRKAATPVLTEADAEALWKILAGENEAEAQRAIRALAAVASQALPFFTKRLKPRAPADKNEIAKRIIDLDSDKFAVRQAAIKALEMVDTQVLEPIQKALKGNTSLETRRRLEQILNTVSDRPNPDTLRAVRAIAVLERISSPEALAVLEDLARGAPGARETEEARASLKHLALRVGKIP